MTASHKEFFHHIYSNLPCTDLCYIIEQFKMLGVKICFDFLKSKLTPQEKPYDRVPMISPESLLLWSLQDFDAEGGNTVISNESVLGTTKDKRVMAIKCSCICITQANREISFSEFGLNSIPIIVRTTSIET